MFLDFTSKGIYCPAADVFIDPWGKTKRALITHAHSDHARTGSENYLAHRVSVPIIKHRLGDVNVEAVNYGDAIYINGVKISFHPAGHIPGSSQIRLEYKGEVAVVSGDYKLQDDGISQPFEFLKCNTFVTESTFGLPIYKWKSQKEIFDDINNWWKLNRARGKTSVLCGYTLGKSQRILSNVDADIGRIFAHESIININRILNYAGVKFKEAESVRDAKSKEEFEGSLVIAPPSAAGSVWMNRFEPYSLGIASGWMNVRGAKRWQAADIGFALSDHADWNELNEAVLATEAENIYVTHGFTQHFVRWLKERGCNAKELKTSFHGEADEANAEAEQKDLLN